MRRGIRWVCAMAAAGAIGGFAQQSQALTISEIISQQFQSPTNPILFEDDDFGVRVEAGAAGIIGDHVFSVVNITLIDGLNYEVSSATNQTIKNAPNTADGGSTPLGGTNSELTVVIGGQIVNVVNTAAGTIIELAPIASGTWTFGGPNNTVFNVPVGVPSGVIALIYEDSTPDWNPATIATGVATAGNGTLIGAAGFTAAYPVVPTVATGANSAGEFFINTESAFDADGIADAFELNLNFLDISGVAGANPLFGPAIALANDVGPGLEGVPNAVVPSNYGDWRQYGAGAELYVKGGFSPAGQGSEWDVASDGDFYVLIPTPAAVIPGLAVLGMLALRRPRREEA